MMRWLSPLLVLFLIAAQDTPPLAITSPAPDELLRGEVAITGNLQFPSFLSAGLEFAYALDPTNTWFLIQSFSQPLTASMLAVWDTTSITDGNYVLRLRVNFEDGTFQEVTVPVQIGNDVQPTTTPEPTMTPEPESVFIPTPFLLAASPTSTELPRPTPTALPPNPVSLGQTQIYASLGRGALVILGLFALAGLIIRVRRY
ncbi:MAG TPA: hypothetical protein VFG81_15735 [Anaerolineales bacterium]|jgi:hypothetical protein|nr:hypothetical protein [Anaerolineales bacterium]